MSDRLILRFNILTKARLSAILKYVIEVDDDINELRKYYGRHAD